VEDCWTSARTVIDAASVVDCGHRLPDDSLYVELGDPGIPRVGDCVAPRSVLEAVLEGRRAALRLLGVRLPEPTGPAAPVTGVPA
jgi:2,4-dienoyl-CoA reductase (NADPH2)